MTRPLVPLATQVTIEGQPETTIPEVLVNVLLGVVGLAILYQALRAYGRRGDRSILLFGTGLFLLTTAHAVLDLLVVTLRTTLGIVSFLLGGLAFSLPLSVVFGGVGQVVDLIGLAVIFYALLK